MSNIKINPSHTIRPMHDRDVSGAAETLAAAFQDDPVFSWCVPTASRRAAILPGFFGLAIDAVLPGGEATVVADGRAAALWVPPSTPAVPDPDAFANAVADLLGDDVDRTFALMEMLDEHHPTEPHRFLWFVGTRPAAQGQGYGSALLREMLAIGDAEGTATYLDATSESNRRLYERHGFEVVGRHTVAGSPPLWAMRRPPNPVA